MNVLRSLTLTGVDYTSDNSDMSTNSDALCRGVAAVAAIAGVIPARRAVRIDPVAGLRSP